MGDKRLLSEHVRKWGWFNGHDVLFLKKSRLKIKIPKNWDTLLWMKKAIITMTSSCHWTTLVPFYLRKKRPENVFFTKLKRIYSQNHTEKQHELSKTIVNWLFNDKWCYLVIGCFERVQLYWYIISLNFEKCILNIKLNLTKVSNNWITN